MPTPDELPGGIPSPYRTIPPWPYGVSASGYGQMSCRTDAGTPITPLVLDDGGFAGITVNENTTLLLDIFIVARQITGPPEGTENFAAQWRLCTRRMGSNPPTIMALYPVPGTPEALQVFADDNGAAGPTGWSLTTNINGNMVQLMCNQGATPGPYSVQWQAEVSIIMASS